MSVKFIMSDFESVFKGFDPDDFNHESNLRCAIQYIDYSPRKRRVSILEFPDEVVLAIFRLCSWRRGQGLRGINATCRAFYTIVETNKVFWGGIDLIRDGRAGGIPRIHINPYFDLFVKRSGGLYLKIKRGQLSKQLLDSIFEFIPETRFVELLPRIRSIQLEFLARLCEGLAPANFRELKLEVLTLTWKEMVEASNLHQCYNFCNLKSLSLDLPRLDDLVPGSLGQFSRLLRNVTIFNIKGHHCYPPEKLDMSLLVALILEMPQLTDLLIGPPCGSHDFTLLPKDSFPNLKRLFVSDTNFLRLVLTVSGRSLNVVVAADSIYPILYEPNNPPSLKRSVTKLIISVRFWPGMMNTKNPGDLTPITDFFQSLSLATVERLYLHGIGAQRAWDVACRDMGQEIVAPALKELAIFGDCAHDYETDPDYQDVRLTPSRASTDFMRRCAYRWGK